MKALNSIYNTIGGKEASNMGIAQGLNNARSELENNPDFQWLEALESKASGLTPLSSGTPSNSSIPDSSALAASFDPQSPEIQAQANLIRSITDIPSLIRLRNRESEKPITSQFLIATINARINNLRSSTTPETIQEKQQRELLERQQAEIIPAPRREPTEQENALTKYQTTLHELLAILIRERRNLSNAIAQQRKSSDKAFFENDITSKKKRVATAVKRIQNHITLARNNSNTKSRANNDWNNRIWQ